MEYNNLTTVLIKAKHPFFGLLFCFMLSGCTNSSTESTALYNEKANELISQVIKESECDCLLQIPKKSLIQVAFAESLHSDIQNEVLKKLNLRDTLELDTLANWSREFQLDSVALKKRGIKIMSLKYFWANNDTLFTICPKGILSIKKPIFNRDFKKAVLDYSWAFSCSKSSLQVYEFKNNQWTSIEN